MQVTKMKIIKKKKKKKKKYIYSRNIRISQLTFNTKVLYIHIKKSKFIR